MNNIKLSRRLRAVADFVRQDAVMADIGTDHGLLVCSLALDGRLKKGYACDVNPLPLEGARLTIKEQGLEDIVKVCLTDGLIGLEDKGITDIVIAGMGGELIARIISDASWTKVDSLSLVLQPMSRDHRLRRFLYSHGFTIIKERAVTCKDKFYTVMQAGYLGEKKAISLHYAWSGLLWNQDNSEADRYLAAKYKLIKSREPSFIQGDGYSQLLEKWRDRFE